MAGESPIGTDAGAARKSHRLAWIEGPLRRLCLASVVVVFLGSLLQLRFGTFTMTHAEAWHAVTDPAVWFNPAAWEAIVFGTDLPELGRESLVVWDLRVPRVVVAVMVGLNLAISGAIFQAVTRNELASPFVLGVSSGAGLTILLTLVVFTFLTPILPIIAALGGAGAFLLVYAIAWKGGTSPVRLVLAGVIVNMVFQSLQRGLFFFADDIGVVRSALAWITGSFTATGWDEVRLIAIPTLFVLIFAIAGARQLNVLLLGSETAGALGMPVERMRFLLSGVAILAAGLTVAVAGIIGFFGLVVPHLVRMVVGSDYKRIVVGCLFVGPALMVAADVGARLGLLALSGEMGQLPVGIVTGLVGGPYFLYLMRRQDRVGDF